MGLDMYLSRRTYVKNWEHTPKDKEWKVSVKRGGKAFKGIEPSKVSYIEEEVAYWRKANHIHQWFVDNVQDGEDNCAKYWVSKEKLEALLELVEKVLAASELVGGKTIKAHEFKDGKLVEVERPERVIKDPTVASELLPTSDGFFFGGTEYDEWYYHGLVETRQQLVDALASDTGEGEYEYQSSW